VVDTSTTAGDNKQRKRVAGDEGGDEEGGKGDGNGDEGGGRAMAKMVKKRVRAARAMVTRVVGDKEGGGDGGNMARINDDGLVPVVVQQAVLYSASASLDDVSNNKSTTGVRAPHGQRWRRPNDDDNDGDIVLSSSHVATPSCPFVSRVALGT
jgi:hypothetical protein